MLVVANWNNLKEQVVTVDESNMRVISLLNGSSNAQNVDWSSTPVEFSYTVPDLKKFIVQRLTFFMEWPNPFNSHTFWDLAVLTNGWSMKVNWTTAMVAKSNKELAQYLVDMKGSRIFWKEDRTIIWQFYFPSVTWQDRGITIRSWEKISTVVNDDLSGLTYLEAMVWWTLIDN